MMVQAQTARIVMTTDAVGGVWTFATTLARALGERGANVLLVSMGPRPSDDQRAVLSGQDNVFLHETDLELEWQDPAGRDFARTQRTLRGLAHRFGADLVHLNGYREAGMGWNVPVVVGAHSCVNSWMESCSAPEAFADAAWSTYSANVEDGLACADAWVAPTASFRDWIARRYGSAGRGHVVWNGFDCSVRMPASKNPVILAAGRVWDSAKNLAMLSSVAVELAWHLRIAGATEVTGGGSHATIPHCEMLGALSRDDMLCEMQRAAIFISPALYEPFGLAVLEAARAGCALVLSDLPSMRELWTGAALFVDPRDAGGWQHALQSLCIDPEMRQRLQAKALARSRRYTVGQMVDGYCKLYASVMDRNTPREPAVRAARISA